MAQCQSPEELLKLVSRVVDAMINQYLLCGTLQGGLVACGESAILPKDTEIVLCRQLADLVQKGIDDGEIVAPTVVEIRYEGSTLILHLADGENLTLDLKPLIDGVIDEAFIDCDGQKIHVGTALATCQNLDNVKIALQQADASLNQRIDDWITDITQRLITLNESIENKIDAKTAEWANTILKELLDKLIELRTVYHDESLIGDGHEPAPLQVNVDWLRQQILEYLPDVVKFTDCCGTPIEIGDVLVTCECLDTQLTSLTNELKAYAEQQDALLLTTIENMLPDLIRTIIESYNYLTVVTTDATLKGNGTTLNPLGVNFGSGTAGQVLTLRADGTFGWANSCCDDN